MDHPWTATRRKTLEVGAPIGGAACSVGMRLLYRRAGGYVSNACSVC